MPSETNARVMTRCSVEDAYVAIDDDRRCTACGELVEEPFEGDERHTSAFTIATLRDVLGPGPVEIHNVRTGGTLIVDRPGTSDIQEEDTVA